MGTSHFYQSQQSRYRLTTPFFVFLDKKPLEYLHMSKKSSNFAASKLKEDRKE